MEHRDFRILGLARSLRRASPCWVSRLSRDQESWLCWLPQMVMNHSGVDTAAQEQGGARVPEVV